MTHDSDTSGHDEPLHDPASERSGPTVDAAVANAEEGTQAEGDHVPSGQERSGESRVEQMPDVVPNAEGVSHQE